MSKIWENTYVRKTILLALVFICGMCVATLFMQTTIKKTEVKTDELNTTIQSLKEQLKTHTKGTTTTVIVAGKTTTTTNWDTNTTTTENTRLASSDRKDSDTTSVTITNPKYLDIYAQGAVDMSSGTPLAGVGFTYNIVGPIIVGGGFMHGFGKSMDIVSIAAGLRV